MMDQDFMNPRSDVTTRAKKDEQGDGEVSALARGLAVLRTLADAAGPLTLKDVSDLSGIPKPTAFRLITTLLSAGLVRRMPDSERYDIGPGVMTLSRGYLAKLDVRTEARSHMRAFAEESGVTVHLGTRDRLEMVLLETVRPVSAALVMRIGVGDRLSLASSASGRAYLAGLTNDDRGALMDMLRVQLAQQWPSVVTQLRLAFDQYERFGFVASLGDWHPDVNAIATPLVLPDGEVYSLNCGGPSFKLPLKVLTDEIAPALRHCADAITASIGAANLR